MTDQPETPEVESVLLDKPRLPVKLVETTESLREFLTSLNESHSPIALDAERASGFRYGQRAYLLQIAVKNDCIFLIDPVACLLYTSPSPRDRQKSRMPSSA